jgi:actin related protein 2/3 complex subunit 5
MDEINNREKEVEKLLSRSMTKEAILLALENPPVLSKSAEEKDANAAVVLRALTSASEKDYAKIVQAAYEKDPELVDFMMKYLYRGLAEHQACGSLLKLHGEIVKVAGLGPIVRSMTDRKTV